MVLKLTLASGEVEDFALEFMIDASKTFGDLHRLIIKHCNYKELEGQRFFICDENWHPTKRIMLHDETNGYSDDDIYLMDDTELGEFLEDEGQRLAYRFDPENRRMFLLELTETIFGKSVEPSGTLNRKCGQPPCQILIDDTPIVDTTPATVSEELGEEFYGEDGFEEDEFDPEGFDVVE